MRGRPLATKILAAHRVAGDLAPGAEIAIRIDQTLLPPARIAR